MRIIFVRLPSTKRLDPFLWRMSCRPPVDFIPMLPRRTPSADPSPLPVSPALVGAVLLASLVALLPAPVQAQVGIQGTMSNFDVFNETGHNVFGAELDLEGVHASDVVKTYPSHFNNMTLTEYSNGGVFGGTRLVFSGYNFTSAGYITPTAGINTNGHYAVNIPGAEHFGFSVRTQPTATKYFWLDQSLAPVSTTPMSIPTVKWTYVPPAGGGLPVVQAVVVPPPPPPIQLYPDAVWVKTYWTEMPQEVDLLDLISGGNVAPQLPSEIEAEWTLLGGDVNLALEEPLAPGDVSVVRRYEYFQYLGAYDEMHLPISAYIGGEPPAGEVGQFIAADMQAAIVVPEPSATALLISALIGLAAWARRRPAPTN